MLSIIGIGLGDEQDITVRGLEAVKKSSVVYLEHYTNQLASFSQEKMEQFYGKKIQLADRKILEENSDKILEQAQNNHVALLIVGSPLMATTHLALLHAAQEKKIPVEVIDNASVLTAVGITGLSLYKFGRVTTIPFDNENVKSPYDIVLDNQRHGLHSLILLDINMENNTMMTAREGLDYLLRMGLAKDTLVVACGSLQSPKAEIKYGKITEVAVSLFPQCIIIPGKLHFSEEEALQTFSTKTL